MESPQSATLTSAAMSPANLASLDWEERSDVRLLPGALFSPLKGRQLRQRAAGVPCTILFDDHFRLADASARLRRAARPRGRGKRRQVAE